jgi:hypothetical protein
MRPRSVGGVLAARLLQPFSSADAVTGKLSKVRLTHHDPHVLFSRVGLELGLIPESAVRDAFFTTGVEAYPAQAEEVVKPIEKLLPLASGTSPSAQQRHAPDAYLNSILSL